MWNFAAAVPELRFSACGVARQGRKTVCCAFLIPVPTENPKQMT
jgi:hypothetical protein